jgi:hypothetical protein
MTRDELLVTVVTSAAVGTLVSTAIGFVGQWLERRARRRELLLTKAVEIAFSRRDFIFEMAKASKQDAEFQDEAVLAAGYYKALDHLMRKKELPPGFTGKPAK